MQSVTRLVRADQILSRWRGLPAGWRLQIGGCALFTLLDLLVRIMVFRDPAVAIAMTAALAPLLLALFAALGVAYRRLGYAGRINLRTLGTIAAFSLGAAAVSVLAAAALREPFGVMLPYWPPGQEVLVPLFYYATIYACWSLFDFWIAAELARRTESLRATEAEAEALRSEVRRLRAQLDPHFLLNALNGIGEELHDDPAAASAMLHNLTQFLHHSLAGSETSLVTLGAELDSLAAFLAVQQARFGTRLQVRLKVAPDAWDRSVPAFLLQPLVENAVKHGDRAGPLLITLVVRAAGDRLDIRLINSGQLATRPPSQGGIGLSNLTRRLSLHYPGRHQFRLDDTAEGVTAHLSLTGDPC